MKEKLPCCKFSMNAPVSLGSSIFIVCFAASYSRPRLPDCGPSYAKSADSRFGTFPRLYHFCCPCCLRHRPSSTGQHPQFKKSPRFLKKGLQLKRGCAIILSFLERNARTTKYGGIAQLGERLNGIQEVSGSIPLISTKKHSISFEIECFSILFSLFCAGHFHLGQQMDNRPSQFLLFLLWEGRSYGIYQRRRNKRQTSFIQVSCVFGT